MNDGNLLLLAVLRTKAREQSAMDALVDYVLDHLPPDNDELIPRRSLVLDAELRVRSAKLTIWWIDFWQPNKRKVIRLLRTDATHYRGFRHPHGDRRATFCEDPNRPTFATQFREVLKVFRS